MKIIVLEGDPSKVAHLKGLEGAEERLHLCEADLDAEGSFDSVVDGCDGVFHTASPVFHSVSDPQKLRDSAVNGTVNVLKSCKKVSSVKRVIVTCSMTSVIINSNPLRPDVVVDESWFSDPAFCQEKDWYSLSKTLAEKAARKFGEENGLDLVTVNPSYIIGPLLQPTLNLSSEFLLNRIKQGKPAAPGVAFRFTDVRDVALAHILAFENPCASGRYCLVGKLAYALDILSRIYPSLNLSPYNTENEPPYQVSLEKAKTLDLKFTPLEVSLRDTIESFKEKNFIAF